MLNFLPFSNLKNDLSEASYGMLPFDERCIYKSELTNDASVCKGAHGDAFAPIEKSYNEIIDSCGSEFCTSLEYIPSGGAFGILEPYGFPYCAVEGHRGPMQCDEGLQYVEALDRYIKCTVDASSEATHLKKEAIEASTSAAKERDASSLASSQNCQDMIKCEEDVFKSVTDDWAFRFCKNFFAVLTDPMLDPNDEYAFVDTCGIGDPTLDPITALCSEVFSGVAIEDAKDDSPSQTGILAESSVTGTSLGFGTIVVIIVTLLLFRV